MGAPKGFTPTAKQREALRNGRRKRNAATKKLGPLRLRDGRDAKVRNGEIPISDLTDEEIARGNIQLDDGTWAPGSLPKKIQTEMQKELYRRAKLSMQSALPQSIKVAHDIMLKGKRDSDRMRAVELFQDRTLGRVPQHVAVHTDSAWEDTFEGVVWASDEDDAPQEAAGA